MNGADSLRGRGFYDRFSVFQLPAIAGSESQAVTCEPTLGESLPMNTALDGQAAIFEFPVDLITVVIFTTMQGHFI